MSGGTCYLPRISDYLFVAASLSLIAFTVLGGIITFGYTTDFFTCLPELHRFTQGGGWQTLCGDGAAGLGFDFNALTRLSLLADYLFFKNWAVGYHVVSLIIHVINAFLVFCVAARLCGTPRSDQTDSQRIVVSLIVAIAFLVFPGNVGVVASASGRPSLVSLMICLICFFISLRQSDGKTGKTRFFELAVPVLVGSPVLALFNVQYALLIPFVSLMIFLVNGQKAIRVMAQIGLLAVSVVFGFQMHQNCHATAYAIKHIAEVQRKTIAEIESLPDDTKVALLNLPGRLGPIPAFTSVKQARGMLSRPFAGTDLSKRTICLDDFQGDDELIDAASLQQIFGKNVQFRLLSWSECGQNYESLSLSTSSLSSTNRALPVVSLGSFERAIALPSHGMASVFANRQEGSDLNSSLLPVKDGISPLDYDVIELTITRKVPAANQSVNDVATLSWSAESFDSTESGAPLRLELHANQGSVRYRLPLATYKRWLTCNNIRAFRLDLPNQNGSASYELQSALLRRNPDLKSNPIRTFIVSSKSLNIH